MGSGVVFESAAAVAGEQENHSRPHFFCRGWPGKSLPTPLFSHYFQGRVTGGQSAERPCKVSGAGRTSADGLRHRGPEQRPQLHGALQQPASILEVLDQQGRVVAEDQQAPAVGLGFDHDTPSPVRVPPEDEESRGSWQATLGAAVTGTKQVNGWEDDAGQGQEGCYRVLGSHATSSSQVDSWFPTFPWGAGRRRATQRIKCGGQRELAAIARRATARALSSANMRLRLTVPRTPRGGGRRCSPIPGMGAVGLSRTFRCLAACPHSTTRAGGPPRAGRPVGAPAQLNVLSPRHQRPPSNVAAPIRITTRAVANAAITITCVPRRQADRSAER